MYSYERFPTNTKGGEGIEPCAEYCVLPFVGGKYACIHICKCMEYLWKNAEENVIMDATRKENWVTECRGGKENFFSRLLNVIPALWFAT